MEITALMSGNVWKLLVQPGDEVSEGQEVAVLESMKMEIPIVVEINGHVREILKSEGEFVGEDEVLMIVE